MNNIIPMKTKFNAGVLRHADPKSKIKIGTWWEYELIRQGKLIDHWENGNVTTDEGLDFMLNAMFHGTAAVGTWYIGIFESNTTPLVTHTYAVPGFTECSAYTEAARQAFVEAAASGKSITNAANKATFTINDTKTIYGAALFGGGTDPTVIGNTAGGGVLFASSKFSLSKSVVSTDVLLVTCTITLADV